MSILYSSFGLCVEVDVYWNDDFQKVVSLSCNPDELFCDQICSSSNSCEVKEGICQNCIGTSLKLLNFFAGMGITYKRDKLINLASDDFLNFFVSGAFISLKAQDVYNVIESFNSIKVYKKFESLCPIDSWNQIVFYEVHSVSRELLKPRFVYCQFENTSEVYSIFKFLDFEINDRAYSWIL